MKSSLATIVGIGLLAAMPAAAATELTVSCTTRDLPPGSRVWIEVEAQYQPQVAAGPAAGGFRDSAPRQTAQAKHLWQFEVPANGALAPISYQFNFPAAGSQTGTDDFATIVLKTRFRIDDPRGTRRPGYGEVAEATFGMPVPAGAIRLSRCLRLRDEGDRLRVETAADCLDASFDRGGRTPHKVRMKAPAR